MPSNKDDAGKGISGDKGIERPEAGGAQGPGPQQADQPEGAPGLGRGGAEAQSSESPRRGAALFEPSGYDEDTGIRTERGGYRRTAPERGDDEED